MPRANRVDNLVGNLLPVDRALLKERLKGRLREAIAERRS